MAGHPLVGSDRMGRCGMRFTGRWERRDGDASQRTGGSTIPTGSVERDGTASTFSSGRPTRRLWLTASAVLAALVLVILVAVGAAGGRPSPAASVRAPAAGVADGSSVRAAEQAVLARRARAILHRDRQVWRADLDTADPAFLAEQDRLFRNLSQVRFASWRYELVGRDYNQPELTARYHAPYVLPAVLLHYAIKDFDPAPVARPEVLTFVRRSGRWLLGSDSDADRLLPETGHADPWDRRAMVTGRGQQVLILADATDAGHLRQLVAAGDAAVDRVASMWPTGWRRRVVIVAVRDQQLLETYFRTGEQSSENVVAIAVPALDNVQGWSARPGKRPPEPSSRVIINPRHFHPGDLDNANTLTHEITHVATLPITDVGTPTWLVEGAAVYTAYRGYGDVTGLHLGAGLREEAHSGSVSLPTYGFYQGQVGDHYDAAWLACRLIVSDVGEAGLRALYRRLGTVHKIYDAVPAEAAAFPPVVHTSQDRFEHALAPYILSRAG